MATEYLIVKHTAGKTVYFRILDPENGAGANLYTWDFDDDQWETSLAAATTPKRATTEKTDGGGAVDSIYTTSYDMATINNTTRPKKILVQAMEDLTMDEVIATQEAIIAEGKFVGLDVENVTLTDTTTTNTDMRGTENAALAASALTNATWTDAKAAYIDAAITSRLAPTVAARTLNVESDGMGHADLKEISGDANSLTRFKRSVDALKTGAVVADVGNTATTFLTDLKIGRAHV